jgi:hypothetical protein
VLDIPAPLESARERGALGFGVALVVALAFALTLGLNYGVSNQVVYLTASLRLLDPTLLTRDWFATQTTHYHPVFAHLGAWLLALDHQGRAVAFAHTLVVTLGGLALYALARALVGARTALAAYLVGMTFVFVGGTVGPTITYVFDSTLQPSTLGSAFFIAAAAAFTAGRFLPAGALLAASGACHLNLLTLLVPAFALATLLLGKRELARRLVLVLGLPALVGLAFLPLFLRASAPNADASLARHVWLVVRLSHHFLLAGKLAGFLPLIAWQCLGFGLVAAVWRRTKEAPFARVAALIAGLLAVVWLGILAGLANDRFRMLFAWRLVPHAELLLQFAASAAAMRVLLEPSLFRACGVGTKLAIGVGFAGLVVTALARGDTRLVLVLGGIVALGAVYRLLDAWHRGPELLAALFALLLLNFAVGPLTRVKRHSTLLSPADASLTGLETWMRERSPKTALFLTPPDEETLRFSGERAIVVDWKSMPALPHEVLEWYRRIGDVVGRQHIQGEADLAGYDELDARRLEALRARYGLDYAVVRRAHAARFDSYPRAYENRAFLVLALRAPH